MSSAPLRTLDADGTEGGQVFFYLPVNHAGLVDPFIHGGHRNHSVKLLYLIQFDFYNFIQLNF